MPAVYFLILSKNYRPQTLLHRINFSPKPNAKAFFPFLHRHKTSAIFKKSTFTARQHHVEYPHPTQIPIKQNPCTYNIMKNKYIETRQAASYPLMSRKEAARAPIPFRP